MILQILLGLSTVNLLSNILNHFQIKRLLLQQSEVKGSPPLPTLEKVEEDLNQRLRMLQTSNFAPKMGRRNIQVIQASGKDD